MKKMFVFAKGCVLGLALMLCGQGAFADSLGMGQGLGETAFNITRAVENQPCAPLRNGDIGMSADGLILSCQSGSWKSLGGVGTFGKEWVSPTRSGNTPYINDTQNNLAVSITYRSSKPTYTVMVDGSLIGSIRFNPSITNGLSIMAPISFIVPPGSTYQASAGFTNWIELR